MVLEDTARRIRTMEIRGAGRIARAAAEALRDHAAALQCTNLEEFRQEMHRAATILTETRPTAVSLPNAVRFVISRMDASDSAEEARTTLMESADEFISRSHQAVDMIAEYGSRAIPEDSVIMTHCNSEVAVATAVKAWEKGRVREAFATEVRPRNQGYITAKALGDAGIPTNFIVDSAARYFMRDIDVVITGADAVTGAGAVVNKIGTSQIALAAHEARVPFLVTTETYKFAPGTLLGDRIPIEERPPGEVMGDDITAGMPNVRVRNPAFDVTPAAYVDMIVTEAGAIPPGMAYVIIRDYLGWKPDVWQKNFLIDHKE
ncbi:translation initiation factor IF-2B subunit delta [Methanomicrobiaceae archaeon CYW5]|uniref:ribose 1,5-bisphosphate isomerase n=1 Tax=Methanovulcanius yangii TaxID=1789227 RepID=UPI0029CA6EE2|nr:ribose 1,5-bisphosphate isomerase [Methanovulcanius yangii]MBT8507089.1 translation initiation factor IF-2B subunit delta [Methanovulcanius yangii]